MNFKKTVITLLAIGITSVIVAQTNTKSYSELIRAGRKLCLDKDFTASAKFYEQAFKVNPNAPLNDRYNAACINSLANNSNGAYKHLFIAANDLKWYDIEQLKNDEDLIIIHKDKKWNQLIAIMQKNKKEIEKHYDKKLVAFLDKIYFDDQNLLSQSRSKEEKYGKNSKEMKALWQEIRKIHSINLIKVSTILDTQGWPSKNRIGVRGTSALFLVIQHADLKVQEKYSPLITKALNRGDLPKRQYAMFYDRLNLRQGKRQVYGTQLRGSDPYVAPLDDALNVDKRRAKMGLNTMQENLSRFNLTWDVTAYLKALPKIEAREKALNEKNKNN